MFNAGFPYEIKWARGCNMSFRREWIIKINGFDENFYGIAVGEEPEFCHRLTTAGGRIRYAPETELFHRFESSGGSRDQKDIKGSFVAYIDNYTYFWCCTEPNAFKRSWQLAKLVKVSLINSKVLFSGLFLEYIRWCVTGLKQGLYRFSISHHEAKCL